MSKDIIYREDAIKTMEQRYKDILRTFKRKVKVGEKAIVLDMIGCVKNLPSADRPQEWIPCSERLPSENGDYLVTLENGVVKILGYSTTQRTTYPKGFYHIEDGFSWRQIQNPVTAWMPLPKPWKGADDEGHDI
jgi:hypothetical protein